MVTCSCYFTIQWFEFTQQRVRRIFIISSVGTYHQLRKKEYIVQVGEGDDEVLLSISTVEDRVSMEKVQRHTLPPGVTERDLEIFRKAQEKASQVSWFQCE